jgi:hypothetical protein
MQYTFCHRGQRMRTQIKDVNTTDDVDWNRGTGDDVRAGYCEWIMIFVFALVRLTIARNLDVKSAVQPL